MTTNTQPNHVEQNNDVTFSEIVWQQFKKNNIALGSLWVLGGLFILAVIAPVVASERPFVWSEDGQTYFPWFRSLFDHNDYENGVDKFFNLILLMGAPISGCYVWHRRSMRREQIQKRIATVRSRKFGFMLAAIFMLVYGLILATQSGYANPYRHSGYVKALDAGKTVEAFFPIIPYGYAKQNLRESLQPPSGKHILGTDRKGRDVAVRMLFGIRISLSVGVIAVGIYVTIGILLGALAGFYRGWVDLVVQRIIEIFMSVPTLIVLLVLVSFIKQPSIFHIMLVIGLFRWTGVARLVRGEFYRLRNLDFVTSAIALGFSTPRIIFHHILPNALGPVLVSATFGVAAAILIESSLSFLGLGDINVPSWGQTLNAGYQSKEWYLILIPGCAIFITVTLLNLVGEGLRDALDPKMRK